MSPRTEETNARIREEQRDRLLKAARTIFAYKGYSDTKMTDIAAAAKVSYGLVYHYFKDKDELFTKIVEAALQGWVALMQQTRTRSGTPWERLHWLTSQMLQGAREQPEAFMVVMQAFVNDAVPDEARSIAWESSVASLEMMKQLVVEGQEAGELITGDPDHLASVFGWCLQGMALGMGFVNRQPAGPTPLPATSFPTADDILRIVKA